MTIDPYSVPNLPGLTPVEPTEEDRTTMARVIERARRHGIVLAERQFVIVPGWGPTLDGLDPDAWLTAMTAE
ncbi:hypothetical protein MYK68_00235 [Gordonia sp. PP30]|uniref:hypothetical protein n=1 Tax=Gordonia sp. PP30 TaxID=2935861 RepID=UPI001FFF0620|nr:hypothetical protein [Gordonia sp. PP30]UQE75117.1 hypothetical protein MYK68_00235 [Gordonia sp. PP30]